MQAQTDKLTERKLVEDFERIQKELAGKVRELKLDQFKPLTVGEAEGTQDLVIEPVYAYSVHVV